MKCFSVHTLVLVQALVITLSISACGAQATPTPIGNAIDIEGTVAAAALTMVAETQAAIPTATPLPPTAASTDTPAPTNTLPPLPSSEVTSTSVPSGGDPCIHKVLPASLQGETVKIRIDNSTETALSLTVYLNQTGPQSECGYRSYTLAAGQFVLITDLVEGCYTLWAWNPDPDSYFIVTNGTSCIDNSNTWLFDVSTSSIKLGT